MRVTQFCSLRLLYPLRPDSTRSPTYVVGLTLSSQRDVVLLLVEQHLSREILEHIGEVGEFDAKPGTGIAVLIDVEDAVGVIHQSEELGDVVEEKI